ncbi:hypothetical protein K1T71_010286 [Dendrolimus kikuchii]|uniref:Uncharacterized protein n=1 Tax=Dendrolimus kikuchii TaxID=765133 RepID=A0ACC1CRT8_9NEOP|nr:hypothetical protein K1T71_010286 [Dendrolimus kikuchii]
MEKIQFLWKRLLWMAIFVNIATSKIEETNTTTMSPQEVTEETNTSGYAWSAWGSWSSCSKTCGIGVSMQERQCLPKPSSVPANGSLVQPVLNVRVRRQISDECPGVARRYHECNNAPCPDGAVNSRADQCAAYDRRPFRGRFYTWVPYIDGDSPCTLNCRPLGQHFYASLSLVADGTPCTKEGYRAICVQGNCQIVGRGSVLAASSRSDMRCGRRLVSGLFARPRLPLGYSYVTTVPRGACRLNVTEIMSSENYIALKISNGSYIMNGEFAVSAPGIYEAAGARFLYTRAAGLDAIFAHGPLHHPIDIMILYTQPNPSIKYEYFTEPPVGEVDDETTIRSDLPEISSTDVSKHIRRHHSSDAFHRRTSSIPRHPDLNGMSKEVDNSEDNTDQVIIGNRKFFWKIMSYTQCTRTCGGGIQLGKYRCVESNSNEVDREVSSVHCTGSPPAGRRRRCGNTPCPPRWRAAAWSACPQCGPATRTRIVGCVQDHSRGITKISDMKCPSPKPATTEQCNVPDCNQFQSGEVRRIEPKRVRTRDHTEHFHDGPVYSLSVNSSDMDIGPEYTFSAAAGWLYTDWSECVGWCVGGGVQTRRVRCADPSGCTPRKVPESYRSCTPKVSCEVLDGQWFTGDWSPCSSVCGGKQIRSVLCIGGTGRHLRDSACKGARPANERDCGNECSPNWYFSDWSQCTGNCTANIAVGVQRRSVVCAKGDSASTEEDCSSQRPNIQRNCELKCPTLSTLPPGLTIESQVAPKYEVTSTQRTTVREPHGLRGCQDKLPNCVLAVQARLCHYKFYTQNCCDSCKGR